MSLSVVQPYPEFLETIKPFVGPYIRFLYTREPDCKKWKYASLYLCLEDTIEDRKLYEKDEIEVDFREKPTSGDRRAVEELNENLTGMKIMRFIEQECPATRPLETPAPRPPGCVDGFVLSAEIKDFR
jgi:hypothetical protein